VIACARVLAADVPCLPESQSCKVEVSVTEVWICIGERGTSVNTVFQSVEDVHGLPEDKNRYLLDLLAEQTDRLAATREETGEDVKYLTIIFVNAKTTAKWVDQCLGWYSYPSKCLHGDMKQAPGGTRTLDTLGNQGTRFFAQRACHPAHSSSDTGRSACHGCWPFL